MTGLDLDRPYRPMGLRPWLLRHGGRGRGPGSGPVYASAPIIEIELLRGAPSPCELAQAAAWHDTYTVEAPWHPSGENEVDVIVIVVTPEELAAEEAEAARARAQGKPRV